MWKKCLFKPDDLANANGYILDLASSTGYFQEQLANATGYMPWKKRCQNLMPSLHPALLLRVPATLP